MRRWLWLVLCATWVLPLPAGAAGPEAAEKFFAPFLGDLRAELAEAKSTGRVGVVAMFHFDDCPYCARMKANVLSRQDVRSFYARRFVAVPVDTRGDTEITDFSGRTWKEKDFARSVPIAGTPTFVFYGLDGKPVARHVGEIKDPGEFILLGEYVATEAWRKQSFKEFLAARPPAAGASR
jgi:thioredoxin-related protein